MSYQLLPTNHSVIPANRIFTPTIKGKTFSRYALVATVLIASLVVSARWASAVTALDTYVAAPDASYGFAVASTIPGPGFTGYNIDLTSQTWRDPSEVTQAWKDPSDPTQNQWNHKMTIVQPDGTPSNTAILFINGGSGPGNFPDAASSDFQFLAGAAVTTNSVFIHLPTVPNERLKFDGENFTRTEDEIIAKTFKKFLDNDPADNNVDQWPLLLPMVKSAVAAMDATQEHMQSQGVTIDKFFVFGASKRGWTTWLTAAVEARPGGPNRVVGIAPAVIDFLNIDESMRHHRLAYEGVTNQITGGFSDQVEDYYFEGVLDHIVPLPGGAISPRAQELLDIVDPYEYRDRLNLPKYIQNGTGDEFFVSDSSQFYSSDLLGPTYLRYIPNTGHGLDDSAIPGALSFKTALDLKLTLPAYSWEISEDGTSISVDTSSADSLVEVKMWKATNPDARDFRMNTFGPNWNAETLLEEGPNEYLASVVAPVSGATAYMIELTYNIGGQELKFTTDISVVTVPEPASCVLLLSGITLGLLSVRRSGFRLARPNRDRCHLGRAPRAIECG